MSFEMKKQMSGLLRGLMLRRHELPDAVETLWRSTPDPRDRYLGLAAQECGFTSKGKAVLRDLIMLMFMEYDGFLNAITIELARIFAKEARCEGNAAIARCSDYGMAYECRNLAAWHFAADRAIARLQLLPVPSTLPHWRGESWMWAGTCHNQNVVSLVAYKDRRFHESF